MNLPFAIGPGFTDLRNTPLLANLARSFSLVSECLHFHLVRKRLFAGENVLSLQIAVHHRDDGFLVRERSYNHRNGAHTERAAGGQSAVSGDQLVAVLCGSCQRWEQHTRYPDAFFQPFHFFILHDLERVIFKRLQLVERKLVHLWLFRVEPLLCAHKELIVPGQAQVYAV